MKACEWIEVGAGLIIAVLLAGLMILSAGMMGIPGHVSPAIPAQTSGNDHASNVTRWMQEHSGQEVTAGEQLEILNPGYLDRLPPDKREAFYRMKIRVPNISDPNPGEYDRSTGGMQYGRRSVAIAAFGYREIPGEQQSEYVLNYTRPCILNESMIAVSNRLADREISVGEYLKTVCPDSFSCLTESQKAALNNQSMTLSGIPDVDARYPGTGLLW